MTDLVPAHGHAAFLSLVPQLRTYARFRFRHLRPGDREVVAEVVAYAFASVLRLRARGKNPAAFPAAAPNTTRVLTRTTRLFSFSL